VPNAPVKNLKAQAGSIAHAFYGRPSESMWVCGVTGTNGKTSCSQWISFALSSANIKTAVVGTLGSGIPPQMLPIGNTTPDVLDLHRLLAGFRAGGAQAVAMEVSSHGLDQGRVNGVAFDCALLTNLTQDHLDYHRTMADYAAAKARLFDAPGLQAAVLNLDDAFGVQLAQRLSARGVHTIGYGLSGMPVDVSEFIFARNIEGQRVDIQSTRGKGSVALPLLGRFNVSNALGVLGCLLAKGIEFEAALALLERLPPVAGRMQPVGERPGQPLVIVDYAHTPDALDKVLAALQPVAQARGGRLVAVFGAGGGRDAAKRPQMGLAAARRADRIVLTSDNPRGEDPLAIIEAIRAGIAGDCAVEPDRAKAIEAAITAAGAADVVLIAGKGHEDTQEIAGRKLPFSDAAVAGAALSQRGAQ